MAYEPHVSVFAAPPVAAPRPILRRSRAALVLAGLGALALAAAMQADEARAAPSPDAPIADAAPAR